MPKMIDTEALLAALRNSTQNPRAVELVIHQLESGDFDAPAATDPPASAPVKATASAK